MGRSNLYIRVVSPFFAFSHNTCTLIQSRPYLHYNLSPDSGSNYGQDYGPHWWPFLQWGWLHGLLSAATSKQTRKMAAIAMMINLAFIKTLGEHTLIWFNFRLISHIEHMACSLDFWSSNLALVS